MGESGLGSAVPGEVKREFVLAKCSYFVDVQLWPLRRILDPEIWLSNFAESEKAHALQLLHSFLYFNQLLIDQLFWAAVQSLSRRVYVSQALGENALGGWRSFIDRLIVTRVMGERPSDVDSGFLFQRMARQVLGLAESQILSPNETLSKILSDGSRPVLFVDDFAGSGRQFLATWFRRQLQGGTGPTSFAEFAARTDGQFFYCPLICTQHGYNRITSQCPEVVVSPAHILSPQYSAVVPDSLVWPESMRESGPEFIHAASRRAGIPDASWRGFSGLGLTLAFVHSVPDATLPIFHWEENGWHPLIKRT